MGPSDTARHRLYRRGLNHTSRHWVVLPGGCLTFFCGIRGFGGGMRSILSAVLVFCVLSLDCSGLVVSINVTTIDWKADGGVKPCRMQS